VIVQLLAGAVLIAAAYQLLALAGALRHLLKKEPPARATPPVSILKPVRGLDPGFREAIRSHASIDYPEFEILFGVEDPADPAVEEILRLAAEFPQRRILLVHSVRQAPNHKVAVLMELAARARHPVLVVNDSDIRVPPDYLHRLVGPLERPGVGLVTCLYRAWALHEPGRWEALGIATDFAPGVLAAPLVGVKEFALGSTLAFRAAELRRIGGFEAIGAWLADDYQLARRIRALGLGVHVSRLVVETALDADTWRQAWDHQLRWHRTIRCSRFGGYLGLPVTHATLWALLAALAGMWRPAAALLALRMTVAAVVGLAVLRSRVAATHFLLVPLRDLAGVVLWAAGLFGSVVRWRDRRLKLDRSGRIAGSWPA